MIKFKAQVTDQQGGKRDMVVLGLTYDNLAQLSDGTPIEVDSSQPVPEGIGLGGGPIVFIFAEKDEGALFAKLRSVGIVTDESSVVLSPGLTGQVEADLETLQDDAG